MVYCDSKKSESFVFSDNFGRFDCFFHQKNGGFEIASDLSLFEVSPSSEGYDQLGLGHLLSNYSSRPAKKQTIYKNVHRLGVGEILNVNKTIKKIDKINFQPLKTENLKTKDLDKYANLFLSSLKRHGSSKCNVVYLSSGWDSTSILAGLVHLFGSTKVKAIVGRMRNSKRSSVLNPYEIKKAKKIADYFKVSLEIVEFDYSKKIPKIVDDIKMNMKRNCVYAGTMNNHGLLAEFAYKNYSSNAAVFCGEISDGVHNLGFSQFTSIFHTSKYFREYSDKMTSYLYGPTFMEVFDKNKHNNDEIFNLLKSLNKKIIFDKKINKNKKNNKMQLLSSFFLRNKRLPLVSTLNDKLFTKKGRKIHYDKMENLYLSEAANNISYDNLYSWYIHLYNSFHWQGSTVATIPLTADMFSMDIQMPFYDLEIQKFLSTMPEDFGRGLDLNPTKYPLKWMLKHKIDYPFHLQAGPHAYVYDTNPSFNLAVEMVNHSGFSGEFRKLLRNHPYKKILSKDIFNIQYIEKIVNKYLKKREISGEELSILRPLCFLFFVEVF